MTSNLKTKNHKNSYLTEVTITGKRGKIVDFKKLSILSDGFANLPVSKKIIVESYLRNSTSDSQVSELFMWLEDISKNKGASSLDVSFFPTRVLMQDYTGIPVLADLASIREKVGFNGGDPEQVDIVIQTDLVVDHSVQVLDTTSINALENNLEHEYQQNGERYGFIKWSEKVFKNLNIIPPGVGIVHQVNLEKIAEGVVGKNGWFYPDSVIGTDSHTSMIGGAGILGWGVGGIEAESVMLGNDLRMAIPVVVGLELIGELHDQVTVTDVVLSLTNFLRVKGVVGKIVEFYGPGCKALDVPQRATIANMAPDYGAMTSIFPIDKQTLDFFSLTNRDLSAQRISSYSVIQDLVDINYSKILYDENLQFDLSLVEPCVSGPSRPDELAPLSTVSSSFSRYLKEHVKLTNGLPNTSEKTTLPITPKDPRIFDGDILLAAITSCTNTSNLEGLICAALVAKKAVEQLLTVRPNIKRVFAPGSKAVKFALERFDLLKPLEQLGFRIGAYGCAACVGNVGNLDAIAEAQVDNEDLIVCSVTSGNRNFEARIHPKLKANFLMSPGLVVAYCLAGTLLKNLYISPIAKNKEGKDVYLRDIWPSSREIAHYGNQIDKDCYYKAYSNDTAYKYWDEIKLNEDSSSNYVWEEKSTYLACPPFLNDQYRGEGNSYLCDGIMNARCLLHLGDYVTTDHISPAGKILKNTMAANYLEAHGANEKTWNTFGSRRGHHEIMLRGAFSNPRLFNRLVGLEGGLTKVWPSQKIMSVYEASAHYKKDRVPLVILSGEKYGAGSSRDWAAKATKLLGVTAVVAESFERIHRSNLVGMGILPFECLKKNGIKELILRGDEILNIVPLENHCWQLNISSNRTGQTVHTILPISLRLDTHDEVELISLGGILWKSLKVFCQDSSRD